MNSILVTHNKPLLVDLDSCNLVGKRYLTYGSVVITVPYGESLP